MKPKSAFTFVFEFLRSALKKRLFALVPLSFLAGASDAGNLSGT